ncbi:MAG: hypothetical protein ACOYK9_02685 [Chlamydiia bacterium]
MILHFIRNLEGLPFGSIEAEKILKPAIQQLFPEGRWISKIDPADENRLTRALFFTDPFKALFIDIKTGVTIALGSLDHLHILYEGDYKKLKPHLESLHQNHPFAFDSHFGFLTSHLLTTGTGCKVKFFREILSSQKPDSIEAIPFEGGYIYQNKMAVGMLESSLIEHLKSFEKLIDEHVVGIKKGANTIALEIFEKY